MEEVEKLRKTANGMTELDDAFSSIFVWLYRPEKTPAGEHTNCLFDFRGYLFQLCSRCYVSNRLSTHYTVDWLKSTDLLYILRFRFPETTVRRRGPKTSKIGGFKAFIDGKQMKFYKPD